MKVLLHDLPKHKELIGKRINVTRQGGEFHYDYQDVPMMRIFEGAKIKKEDGKKWIVWNWKPEYSALLQGIDCGWSGNTLESHEKFNSWLDVDGAL